MALKAKTKKTGKVEQNRTIQYKRALLEALEQSLGIVTVACRTSGVSRMRYYEWMKNDPEFAKAVEGIADIALDFVESAHYQEIKKGTPSNIIFHLKTKGRKRGYQENLKLSGDEESPIKIDVTASAVFADILKMTPEEQDRELEKLRARNNEPSHK